MTIGADICKYIEAPLRLNCPCHSQTVEHAVQITSSVSFLLNKTIIFLNKTINFINRHLIHKI